MTSLPAYEPGKGLGALDKLLMRGAAANKSGRELSALTNGIISPAAAMARVDEIVEERNWLSEARREMLLLDEFYALKDKLLTTFELTKDLDYAKVLRQVLGDIGNRLDKRQKALDVDLNSLYGNQARLMAEAIELTFQKAFASLQAANPAIDNQTVRLALETALPQAVAIISERNEGEPVEL
jgi:hypothetical protein